MREGEHWLEHQHAELTERKAGKVEIYESCAMGFVHDPLIIGREEKVKVFKPRAIRWETSVRFGLEDREREGQQATTENKSQQAVEGRGKGMLPSGWFCPPPQTTQQHPSFYPHAPPSCLPPHPPQGSLVRRADALHRNLGLFRLQCAACTLLFPFSGHFVQYRLRISLNLALDARNTLYSSSHFNPLQHP